MYGTQEKSTNKSKGKPEQKLDAAYGTIFRISVFKEASKNFILELVFSKKHFLLN